MVIQKIHPPRTSILKKRYLIASKTLKNLHEAIKRFRASDLAFEGHPELRLMVIHCYEQAFHAVCNYIAEQLQTDYEFEKPEQSAQQLFQQAYIADLVSQDEYEACLNMVQAFTMTPDVYKENVANEACYQIAELFEVMCTVAQFSPNRDRW